MKNFAAISVIFFTTLFHQYLCHPEGAPSSQCEEMKPDHGVPEQKSSGPYEVKVEQSYYMPGEYVKLSIESLTDDIKGFFIQARKVGENAVTGSFAKPPANTKYVTCNSNIQGAITHAQRLVGVKTINFEWQPPIDLYENITFYATVVKDKSTFWVKRQSSEIYKNVENTTAAPTISTPTTEQELIVYEDCIQAQEKTCNDSLNRIYSIKARTELGYASLECLDNNTLTRCPGSGWTKVGELRGSREPNTSFHSDAWTSKNTSYGFNVGFWSAYVGEVCFYSKLFGFVFPLQAPSLRSLFFGKKLLDVDKNQFLPDSVFVKDCYEVGFNVGDPDFVVIRAGIVAVRNKTGCESVPPSAIGVGIYNVTSPIMGNAHGYLNENGLHFDNFIVAVRWRPEQEPTQPTTSA